MPSIDNQSDPLKNFTKKQFENLEKSIETLELEEDIWNKEQKAKEDEKREKRAKINIRFQRLRRSPIEIINRLLLFFFLSSFLFSFFSVYLLNRSWFIIYVISAFSCILYSPNRKALKELLAAWPNIQDLINKRSLWRK
tara:strand:+ start:427 stop:843 length:417 start_codon:yes stop_codon:yes gene_type:complete